MRIGAMNNPTRDPVEEIERIARSGFEFVDLTLEPPAARSDRIDIEKVKRALRDAGLGAVGAHGAALRRREQLWILRAAHGAATRARSRSR